jgi:hypothetical protein
MKRPLLNRYERMAVSYIHNTTFGRISRLKLRFWKFMRNIYDPEIIAKIITKSELKRHYK